YKSPVRPSTNVNPYLSNYRPWNAHGLNRTKPKDVSAINPDSTLSYLEVGSFSWNILVPNEAPGFSFSDHRYVKAVAMALDRDEILQSGPAAGIGLVGWGPISPAHFAYDASFKPWPKADPDGAKKLIADVGKGPLKFELLVPSGDAGILQAAQLIKSELAKADITMDLKTQTLN